MEMPKKYRPSNGTEGDIFIGHWCASCARDKHASEGKPIEECEDNELCPILGKTMAHDVDDPEFPGDWIYDGDGKPCCTSWLSTSDKPVERCEHTIDWIDQLRDEPNDIKKTA